MAEAGGSLEVVPRDGASSLEACSLPELQTYLEASEFGIAYLNGRLLCSPKAKPFALAIQSALERAMKAAAMNRIPLLDDEGALLPAPQTLATVGFDELQKMVAALMNGQRGVDEQPPRTRAEVPEWFPSFPVPDDARFPGHSPGCFLPSLEFLPLVTARCKAPTVCGRKPTPAEYREHKFRGRMQGLKQTELLLLVDAIFRHFRGQPEKLEKLEDIVNRYFEKSKPSVHLQATMGEYFSFLRAEARTRRDSQRTVRAGCSLGGGQAKATRAGSEFEVPSLESEGRVTSVADDIEKNRGEKTPKRRREDLVVDRIDKPSQRAEVIRGKTPETEVSVSHNEIEGGYESDRVFKELPDLESSEFVRKYYRDDSDGAFAVANSFVDLGSAPDGSPLEEAQGDQSDMLGIDCDGIGVELSEHDPEWKGLNQPESPRYAGLGVPLGATTFEPPTSWHGAPTRNFRVRFYTCTPKHDVTLVPRLQNCPARRHEVDFPSRTSPEVPKKGQGLLSKSLHEVWEGLARLNLRSKDSGAGELRKRP